MKTMETKLQEMIDFLQTRSENYKSRRYFITVFGDFPSSESQLQDYKFKIFTCSEVEIKFNEWLSRTKFKSEWNEIELLTENFFKQFDNFKLIDKYNRMVTEGQKGTRQFLKLEAQVISEKKKNDRLKIRINILTKELQKKISSARESLVTKKNFYSFLKDSAQDQKKKIAELEAKRIDEERKDNELFQMAEGGEVLEEYSSAYSNKIVQKNYTLKEIALIYFYNESQITRGINADGIAKEYGLTSGEALYQDYTWYSSKTNRTGIDELHPKRNIKKLELIGRVISYLPEKSNARENAIRDYKSLDQTINKRGEQ